MARPRTPDSVTMLPLDTPYVPVANEPRIGGAVRTTEEEEELLLALTILRLNQRLSALPKTRTSRD